MNTRTQSVQRFAAAAMSLLLAGSLAACGTVDKPSSAQVEKALSIVLTDQVGKMGFSQEIIDQIAKCAAPTLHDKVSAPTLNDLVKDPKNAKIAKSESNAVSETVSNCTSKTLEKAVNSNQ